MITDSVSIIRQVTLQIKDVNVTIFLLNEFDMYIATIVIVNDNDVIIIIRRLFYIILHGVYCSRFC